MGRCKTDEINQIIALAEKGVSTSKIAEITGRSTVTVYRIRKEQGLLDLCQKADNEKERWLQKNWHWKNPKDQHATRPGAKKREKKKSNFRTPYKFPGKVSH